MKFRGFSEALIFPGQAELTFFLTSELRKLGPDGARHAQNCFALPLKDHEQRASRPIRLL
jgi:hypothetical protein